MAFRSVRMRLFNMTSNTLTKVADQLNHGEYSFAPPATIVQGQRAEWQAESEDSTFLVGTVGNVDYRVDGRGDRIKMGWDNSAVGPTRFPVSIEADGRPSDFVFFTLHLAIRGDVDPDPGQDPPVFAVTQGDIGPDAGTGLILPFPGQKNPQPHAWFDIGVRNRREPVDVGRWLRALGIDPSQGTEAILLKKVDVNQLINLPLWA